MININPSNIITRNLIDFNRNPKYYINNVSAMYDLISYYIYENSKILFNKNLDINILLDKNKDVYIDELIKIKNNLEEIKKVYYLNNSYDPKNLKHIVNVFTAMLVTLINIYDALLLVIKSKSKTINNNKNIDIVNNYIYIKYFNDYKQSKDNKYLIKILENIDTISQDEIDKLLSLINDEYNNINNFEYSSHNDLLNINNVNIINNELNEHIITYIDEYVKKKYKIDNKFIDNKSLIFWRALQIHGEKIFLQSIINRDISNLSKSDYLLLNLYAILLDIEIINNLIKFLLKNKSIKINKKILDTDITS
jgi:hypothetical protein